MKLSEAMRKGYEEHPELRHVKNHFAKVLNGKVIGCCAMTFAYIGAEGIDKLQEVVEKSSDRSMIVDFVRVSSFIEPQSIITHNDVFQESMSDIIAWVESQERSDENG